MQHQLADTMNYRELYVQMDGGDSACKAYYKTAEGRVVEAAIDVHPGMFADSVLIGGKVGFCECDWRYYPRGSEIECYHWSGELETVRIENIGRDFVYRGYSRDILCKHGERITVTREDFAGEGVFSPDAVRMNRSGLLSQGEINKLLGADGDLDSGGGDMAGSVTKKQMWDVNADKYVDVPEDIENFLNELTELYKKYDLSIAHEDIGGGFVIENLKEENVKWIQGAMLKIHTQ